MLTGFARRALERVLAARGYELRERGEAPRGFEDFLSDAALRGISPATVFDIGVGYGTSWLYAAFPKAKHVLIEPQPAFDPAIKRLRQEIGADHHALALADHEGKARLHVPQGYHTGASLRARDGAFDQFTATRRELPPDDVIEVPVDTLDRINRYDPPFLVKLDVEGSELDVLRGARMTLLVIAEVSVVPRFEGKTSLKRLLVFMRAEGFRLVDIPCLNQACPGGPLLYLDVAFAAASDERWLT